MNRQKEWLLWGTKETTNDIYLWYTVVTNCSTEISTLLSVKISFSEVIQQLTATTVSHILTVLDHSEEVVNMNSLGIICSCLVHYEKQAYSKTKCKFSTFSDSSTSDKSFQIRIELHGRQIPMVYKFPHKTSSRIKEVFEYIYKFKETGLCILCPILCHVHVVTVVLQ